MDYSPVVPEKSTGPQSVYPELTRLRTPQPSERADAARNRAAIVEAAARLFAEHGVDAVSMDAIAAAAGVGKGTLFRRFGDKSGLANALLDTRERELQQRILSGEPPLGPGAPPAERLEAFTVAYLDYLLPHVELVRMSETASPGARYRIGAYRFWHRHVAILLTEMREFPDPEVGAHAILAPMAAELVAVTARELGTRRVRDGVIELVRRVLHDETRERS